MVDGATAGASRENRKAIPVSVVAPWSEDAATALFDILPDVAPPMIADLFNREHCPHQQEGSGHDSRRTPLRRRGHR